MKIVVVCHDIPYPPTHGGRLDMWERIKAFSHLGVKLYVVCWSSDEKSLLKENLSVIKGYVEEVHIISKTIGFKSRLKRKVNICIDLLSYPKIAAIRNLTRQDFNHLLKKVSTFSPDIVWLDGIYGGIIANKLSKSLDIPLITRSQNIEHLYYKRLLSSTTTFNQKLNLYLSLTHMEKYEKKILRDSSIFYDISIDDLKFWQSQGFNNGIYLPPVFNPSKEKDTQNILDDIKIKYDIVFVGNLNLYNNVAGITWLVNDILPNVWSKLPKTKVLIAGSRPIQQVRDLCAGKPNIDLLTNPVSSKSIYRSGRVLVNPAPEGSGVSMKSIDMLYSGRHIVSTPQGIVGLPQEVKQYFKIASDTRSFSKEIIDILLSDNNDNMINTDLIHQMFGIHSISNVILDMNQLLLKNNI